MCSIHEGLRWGWTSKIYVALIERSFVTQTAGKGRPNFAVYEVKQNLVLLSYLSMQQCGELSLLSLGALPRHP